VHAAPPRAVAAAAARPGTREAAGSAVVVLGCLAAMAGAVLTDAGVVQLAPVMAMTIIAVVAYRSLLTWHALLVGLIGVILFIPIRRYQLPGSLPFDLEPYRLVVAFIVLGWFASLLVDRRVVLLRTGFEGPIALIAFAALGSVVANPGRVAALSDDVTKDLTFLASFLVLLYLITSVVSGLAVLDLFAKVLVTGGCIVGMFALIESYTGYNVFNDLGRALTILEVKELPDADVRGARLRVSASAQHPIALGAAFAMILPLAIYLAKCSPRRRPWWLLTCVVLVLGAVATVSRTGILMLLVVGLVFLRLRPRETKRLWPLLLPALVVAHLVLPGAIGSLKSAFFPAGGLVAEQSSGAGRRGSGRIADIGPGLTEWSRNPVLGQGLGTRITDAERQNASILDNQWLRTLLETGLVGLLAWLWLFVRSVRRLCRAAREDSGPRGWLLTAIAASVTAYAFAMLTYDAFSFIQVTFLMFMTLGFASVALRMGEEAQAGSSVD